jgi:hypothetical protein
VWSACRKGRGEGEDGLRKFIFSCFANVIMRATVSTVYGVHTVRTRTSVMKPISPFPTPGDNSAKICFKKRRTTARSSTQPKKEFSFVGSGKSDPYCFEPARAPLSFGTVLHGRTVQASFTDSIARHKIRETNIFFRSFDGYRRSVVGRRGKNLGN